MGRKATITYNLKETTGQLNIHENKYCPQLRQYVQENLSEMLYYYGYVKLDNQDCNPTGFFEFSEADQKPEHVAMNGKFRENSQKALDLVCSSSFDKTRHYETNAGETV